jgi:hypothetical protein
LLVYQDTPATTTGRDKSTIDRVIDTSIDSDELGEENTYILSGIYLSNYLSI